MKLFALAVIAATMPLTAAVLPTCHGDPAIDDTPMLAEVIQKSNANIWTLNPSADCYVHFTGANSLPAGTKLEATPAGPTLHLFTSADNLFSLNHSDVTLDGLTLDSPFASITGYHGVLLWITGQNFKIENCKIGSALATGTAIWAWNASGAFLDNEITGFSGQIFFTASPGKEPHIRIVGNRLHDNNAGGNAIGIASDNGTKADIPALIEGNWIWNIQASSTSSGQNGNGVDLDHANKVRLIGNHSKNTRFSCWRAFSSDGLLAEGNECIDAGEIGGYSEFASQNNQWVNNYFENAASGCLSLTNSNDGGQQHTAIGNRMVGCGGSGIQAEAAAVVEGNFIDQAATGIYLGYGTFGRHVLVQGNLIMDSSGTGKTQRGIAIEANTQGDMEISGNMIDLPAHQIEGTAWGALAALGVMPVTTVIRDQTLPFASLGVAGNGSRVYCPDCVVGPVCTGSGTGAFAKRLNNVWSCN